MLRRALLWSVAVLPAASLVAQDPVIPASVKQEKPAVVTPVAKVDIEAKKKPMNGSEMLPKWLAEARVNLAKNRDYTAHLVRQERVASKLTPEQIVEVRYRAQPQAINLKTIKPLELAGEETTWNTKETATKVRFRPAGIEGVRGFQTLEPAAPKVLKHTLHPANEVGFSALVERVEKMLATEKLVHGGAAIYATEYKFADKPVVRFEILADRAHPARYAPRCLVYMDMESKLPVRFEAYDEVKTPGSPGELIESQSYIDIKFNVGLGEANFNQ